MWFKNLCLYRFTQDMNWQTDKLNGQLSEQEFKPCGLQQTVSIGWVPPMPYGTELFHQANNCILVCMKRQERLLPGTVVSEQVAELVEQIQSNESRKISRKERLEIKEKVVAELLPKAFVRSTLNYMYIDQGLNVLVIASASANRADEMTELLRSSVKTLPVVPLAKDMDLSQQMTRWLLNPSTMPQFFEAGEELEIKQPSEGEPVVKVKNWHILDEHFNQYFTDGWLVEKMALKFNEQMEFILAADCSVKRIRYTDELIEKSYDMNPDSDKAVQADADFMLNAELIGKFAAAMLAEEI